MTSRYFFFLLITSCILLSHTLYAQNKEQVLIDSLLTRLTKAKEDTNKVNLYWDILFDHQYYKEAEGLKYEQPALELAEKIKWKVGVANIKYVTGRIYWRLGDFDNALKRHFEALILYAEAGNQQLSATTLTSIGQDYADGGRYAQAQIFLLRALKKFEELGDKSQMSNVYSVLSWVYNSQGNYVESSKCNYAALRIFEQLGDKEGVAIATANIAEDNYNLGNYQEALKYSLKSIKLLQDVDDKINEANSYNLRGKINKILINYSEAIKDYSIALQIGTEIKDMTIVADSHSGIGSVYQLQDNYIEALKNYVMAADGFKSISNQQELASLLSEMGTCYSKLKKYKEAKKCFDDAFALSKELKSNVSYSNYYHGKELLDSATGSWESAYKNYKRYIVLRDSTFNKENLKKLLSSQMQYDAEKKEAAEKAEREKKEAAAKAEQEKKDIRQRTIRNSIAGVLAGALIFLIVVYRQRNKIKAGKKRSDELLLNILPEEVAEELKSKGSADAKQFDEVTVMFTDFKGFTQISEKLSAKELVAEIDTCFKAFDNIITKHNIEKIKTIGDAYMCAGGLPVANTTHADDVVKAGLEIQAFMKNHKEEREKRNLPVFEIRIGIHTGAVVAGIVGVKKFAYDIWGDTVNIASRMESSGEAGKVNISGATCELVKEKFNCVHRGKIQAKNKGEIEMYFIEQSI